MLDLWRDNYKITEELRRKRQAARNKLDQERQRIFDAHRAGLYSDAEFLEQKDMIAKRIAQLDIDSLPVSGGDDFDMEAAVEHCFDFVRDTARRWQKLDYANKLRFQKLIFEENITFDGSNFGTAQLSPIYALSERFDGDSSNLVTPIRAQWNRVVECLRLWTKFQPIALPKLII